jgi:hypothetical protein
MAPKTSTEVAVVWNVGERRVESYHESLAAAENAKVEFISKSGVNADTLDLDVSSFTARVKPRGNQS